MDIKQYEAGEVRRFTFRARTSNEQRIVIASGSWKLIKTGKKTLVSSGECDISGSDISMVVPLYEAGEYYIELTVEIPPETIIERINIRVVA